MGVVLFLFFCFRLVFWHLCFVFCVLCVVFGFWFFFLVFFCVFRVFCFVLYFLGGLGLRFWVLGLWFWWIGLKVRGLGCRVHGSGLRCSVWEVVEAFRRGLVFKAHRLLYHSTPGSRAIKKKQKKSRRDLGSDGHGEVLELRAMLAQRLMSVEEQLAPPCTLHPAPCTPALCTLHPAPYILHPALCTLHPAPCTLHPALCNHAPCTLHPAP